MLCSEYMCQPAVTIAEGATVQRAAQTMLDAGVGFLPVCDPGGRLVGVVTERDMARRLCATGGSPCTTTVRQIMTREVLGCAASDDVWEAERMMARTRRSHIVVLDERRVPVGVISLSDVLSRAAGLSETVRDIAALELCGRLAR